MPRDCNSRGAFDAKHTQFKTGALITFSSLDSVFFFPLISPLELLKMTNSTKLVAVLGATGTLAAILLSPEIFN